MKQKTRLVFPVLAVAIMAMPALSQNAGTTGGGNRPMATQRTLSQLTDATKASITNTTSSPVTITLDTGDVELQIKAAEAREVSCSQKAWVGTAKDASTAKAVSLTCKAKYQIRANGAIVEIVLAAAP